MFKCEYEKVTIENIENAIKTGYIKEIICDGDTKAIIVDSAQMKMLEEAIAKLYESVREVVNAVWEFGKSIVVSMNTIFNNLSITLGGKLTKKKFIKLLQSRGIQRNEINKIIENNNQPYTYFRLNTILEQREIKPSKRSVGYE